MTDDYAEIFDIREELRIARMRIAVALKRADGGNPDYPLSTLRDVMWALRTASPGDLDIAALGGKTP